MSAFSFTSENSFPSAPVEWMAIARMPASGPMPNGQTRMNASTTCGIERITSSSRRVIQSVGALRTRLRAAGNDSTKAPVKPITVASIAIWIVCQSSVA